MGGRSKGSESTTRRDLRTQLALERIVGRSCEREFTAPDTERGKELEADALACYEARTGHLLSSIGFARRDDLPIGCSPDGAVVGFGIEREPERQGEIAMYPLVDVFLGGVDVKCPRPANHLSYLREPSKLVAAYEAQLAHTLLTTSAPWWDLASYCPQFPAEARLLIVRLVPAGPVAAGGYHADYLARIQAVDLEAHEKAVRQFLAEVAAEEADIRTLTTKTQEAA